MTLTIKQPWDVPELDLNAYQYRFLAEGDSWFSIGEFPPWATSSLLFGMSRSFAASNLVINCARQGDTLSHMHQMWFDSNFTRMLDAPHLGYYWDALLLSAGGNDLIDACLVAPTVTDPARRLLLRPEEIPSGAPPHSPLPAYLYPSHRAQCAHGRWPLVWARAMAVQGADAIPGARGSAAERGGCLVQSFGSPVAQFRRSRATHLCV